MVDMWSKWAEAFPSSKQTAAMGAKALLTEIFQRWGILSKISSNNGAPFVNKVVKQLSQYLQFDLSIVGIILPVVVQWNEKTEL